MKVLAFVDLHGEKRTIKEIIRKAKKEDPDLLVCAGDISYFGKEVYTILKEFKCINKPLLIIPGNHEIESDLKRICRKLKFAIYLHEMSYKLNDYLFFGYGGGGFAQIDKEFEIIANKFKKTINKHDKIILVVHAPIYGTKIDLLYGEHLGNKSMRKFIEKTKIDLVICGHFHETKKEIDVINKTKIINPGNSGTIIQI